MPPRKGQAERNGQIMEEEQQTQRLTQAEYDKLKAQLDEMKTTGRKEIAEKIKLARSFGDLSENAEYDEAKKEQAFTEGEIVRIEKLLKEAEIIDEASLNDDSVNIGSFVKVYDYDMDCEDEYQLVGSTEFDPDSNKISSNSPIGSAFMHKKVGDRFKVEIPDGEIEFRIIEIHR